jgi:hypothetical protein
MRYLRDPRTWLAFVLGVALTVTVPLKFLVSPVAARSERLDIPISAFLLAHGLQPRVEARISGPVVHATSDDCRMLIMEMEPRGTNLDRIDSAGKAVGSPVVFVFEGVVYREPPVRRTLLKYYWSRLEQRLGFKGRLEPVLAVAASEKCSVERLPWADIVWLQNSSSSSSSNSNSNSNSSN